MYKEQLPPHDPDAEESVLGSVLIDSGWSAYQVRAELGVGYRTVQRALAEVTA